MDHEVARQRLSQAETDIIEEQKRIDEHKATIRQLQAAGHDASSARKSLEILEHSKKAFEKHRNILLEQLGLYEEGESGMTAATTPTQKH